MIAREKAPESLANGSPKAVFIVEDHPVFREGLVQILNDQQDVAIVGQAGSAEEAMEAIPRLKPDLVLVDISLPGKTGLELIKEVRGMGLKVKLLVVSMRDEAVYASRVLRAGADGYVMKQADPEELVHAIRDVLRGHLYVSEEVLAGEPTSSKTPRGAAKARRFDQLTDAELEILESLSRGRTGAEIAEHLCLSSATVAEHCRQLVKKLNLGSQDELICYAVTWAETSSR